MKKSIKTVLLIAAALMIAAIVLVAVANITVISSAKTLIDEPDSITYHEDIDFILVLGCGVKPDGSPSDMLRDRLARACEVYENHAGAKILLSGDGARDGYDEITPMINYCLEHGVSESDIVSDRYGVSTYESVKRAKREFGAKRIIIITQNYHLYRALYIAERFGITAYGVGADIHEYAWQRFRDVRETAARTKDFLITLITK